MVEGDAERQPMIGASNKGIWNAVRKFDDAVFNGTQAIVGCATLKGALKCEAGTPHKTHQQTPRRCQVAGKGMFCGWSGSRRGPGEFVVVASWELLRVFPNPGPVLFAGAARFGKPNAASCLEHHFLQGSSFPRSYHDQPVKSVMLAPRHHQPWLGSSPIGILTSHTTQ